MSTKEKDPIEYSISSTYKVNDVIYHKVFDDIGTVLDIGITKDNEKKMTVSFKKTGKKRLIMGVLAKK
ncbi:MAG: hypothetical protein A2008_09640 [Candidatus Wallbacteria bacterium GWC2_49_35]|uniref:Uncharacterized protein n=1 Tax=Candidatus Wallbacteria bacterium GWC2_49_35 TaxID=1817813 RepID=A0A1F7WWA0_9BACT|nr:MAG: hypothetical protein A2008_09640 [Candidatus Wallbacteria bacterium GWC2_49_35]HBC73564.1 hypothetical protein [Candidatus Wallbacteria bacterium]